MEGTTHDFFTIFFFFFFFIFFLHFSGEGNRILGGHLAIVTSQRMPELVFEPRLSDSRTGALSHAIIVC